MTEEVVKIFYSYSREDLAMRNTLDDHLSALKNAKKIQTWHDLQLEAGTEWERDIQNQLNTADIILLLVSRSFMASKYCYSKELQVAIDRHNAGAARVIPVILRPCDWNHDDVPFSKLNVLPTHAQPITSWSDREEAYAIVARKIRETVEQIKDAKSSNKPQITIAPPEKTPKELAIPTQKEPQQPIPDELASEKGVDYGKLRDLLKAGKWREADDETLKVMLKAANRESEGFLISDSVESFPCKDLKTINLLWVNASNGHFGFSVQKNIWEKCGSPMSCSYNDEWKTFGDLVGWRQQEVGSWLNYSELKFALDFSPVGELPILGGRFFRSGRLSDGSWRIRDNGSLFSRTDL
jgi:hypothetical protein